jgi:elongator complex protein 3
MKIAKLVIKKLIRKKVKTEPVLSSLKRKIAKTYKVPLPSNIQLLRAYHKLVEEKRIKKSKTIENLLKTRPVRSLSGIVNISVLTKPYPCPGKCIFCPLESGLPKSYLTGEPAAERAKALNFSPFLQTKRRIEMLKAQGHPTDKIEIRIVGGTWSYYPKQYQTWFIKRCFDGCNGKKSKSLKEAQKLNEKAKNRIVGLSIETRPDFVNPKEILRLRRLGVTLVELGVQSIFDEVLKKSKTGLTSREIERATRLLKEAGFKVLYQVMPNLPGSDLKKDLKCFETIFQDQRFKPDWLKIYPCLVCKTAKLYKIWQKGKYKPYSDKKLIELLIKIKRILPYWVRLTRLLRDIPAQKIIAGCKISNLREVIQAKMKEKGYQCECIRCREIGEDYNPEEKVNLFRQDYDASGGKEIFLSYESKNRKHLYSLLRLRIPSQFFSKEKHFIPVLENSAIIREIHTYGQELPIARGKTPSSLRISPQHKGLGKKLIKEAEKIAKKEFGLNKIAVISAIGVREYFRDIGYNLKDEYMIKSVFERM